MRTLKPVLLVEDDRVDAMTVKRALRDLDVKNHLIHVINGEQALVYLKNTANPEPCLKGYGLAQILVADCNPAANLAKKPRVFYQSLILFGIAYLIANIVQVTKVLVVAAVRHTCLCHCFFSVKELSNLIFISRFAKYSKNQHNKKNNCRNVFNIPRHHPSMLNSIRKSNAANNIIEKYAA